MKGLEEDSLRFFKLNRDCGHAMYTFQDNPTHSSLDLEQDRRVITSQ